MDWRHGTRGLEQTEGTYDNNLLDAVGSCVVPKTGGITVVHPWSYAPSDTYVTNLRNRSNHLNDWLESPAHIGGPTLS